MFYLGYDKSWEEVIKEVDKILIDAKFGEPVVGKLKKLNFWLLTLINNDKRRQIWIRGPILVLIDRKLKLFRIYGEYISL